MIGVGRSLWCKCKYSDSRKKLICNLAPATKEDQKLLGILNSEYGAEKPGN